MASAEAIAAFWSWWGTASPRIGPAIGSGPTADLVDEISGHVKAIDPGLGWEVGSGQWAEHSLCVTPQGDPRRCASSASRPGRLCRSWWWTGCSAKTGWSGGWAASTFTDGIEHCGCLTVRGMELSDHLLESLAARQIQVCPTLGKTADAVPPPALVEIMARTGMTWEARLAAVGRMHRAGVQLVAGADAGISAGKPHGILPEAVVDLVGAGLSPAEALASATSVAARTCGLGERKGRLRVGYDADLLLVDGDPLTDISALRRVSAVLVGGQTVRRHPWDPAAGEQA